MQPISTAANVPRGSRVTSRARAREYPRSVGYWHLELYMHAMTVNRDIPQRRAVRLGRGAVASCARASLLVLCMLVVAGCGEPTPVAQRSRTVTPAVSFVPNSVVGTITSLHMFDATTGWAATDNRVLRTTDGGLHWRNVTPPAPPAQSGASPSGLTMFPHSAADTWVARGLTTDGGSGAPQSAVSHTMDSGQTWRTITLPVFA